MRTAMLLWVAVGGALGAVARYSLGGAVHRVAPATFPYGTFAVNVLGCLLFGLLAGAAEERLAIGPSARTFLLIGLLGGFTTFSTFSWETLALLRDGQWLPAAWNGFGQLVLGLVAVWAGLIAARLLSGTP